MKRKRELIKDWRNNWTYFKLKTNAFRAFLWTNCIGKPLKAWPFGTARRTASWNSSLPTDKPVTRSNSYDESAGLNKYDKWSSNCVV